MVYSTYLEIKKFREQEIDNACKDHAVLNRFHDQVILEVVKTAIYRIREKYGPCPSPFSFIVMGSAGRLEQSIWSDQDHGIIYQDEAGMSKQYFLKIGKEISEGLFQTGYPYCDGDVMASNPLWCHSISEWRQQLTEWIRESTWETIRYLLIFIDGRCLYGEDSYINGLKMMVYQLIQENHLLPRILENTSHFKKGLGILGQFLVETHGSHTGALNIKEKVLFPYVNAVRLLAIKENILESSTISRLQKLSEKVMSFEERLLMEEHFLKILHYRLVFANHSNYESGHYLSLDKLTPFQKKELKDIIKVGNHLFQSCRKLVTQDEYE